MLIKHISASRLETFALCLFKYYMTYHDKVPLKSNWGATHGSLLHDILEKFANRSDQDWMSRLYQGYAGKLYTQDKFGEPTTLVSPLIYAKDADFKNQKPHCDTCPFADLVNNKCKISQDPLDKLRGCPKKLFENSVRILEGVFRRYTDIYNNQDKLIGTEYKVEFDVKSDTTSVPLICIMDVVRKIDEDTIEIIDYKFGNWTKSYEDLMQDNQTHICSYAARKEFIDDIHHHGYKFKNIILTFDYFMASPITLAFTLEDDLATERYLLESAEKIRNTKTVTRMIGSGNFGWKCKALCDVDQCKLRWKGNFTTNE